MVCHEHPTMNLDVEIISISTEPICVGGHIRFLCKTYLPIVASLHNMNRQPSWAISRTTWDKQLPCILISEKFALIAIFIM
ncbi:MAG: hypothetical protein ACJARY_001222 [Candidatus Azotimanducaceae bacterium]|jgi:hypothetical protein